MVINHKEALELAYCKRENSNLARAYIELRTLAIASLDEEIGAMEIAKVEDTADMVSKAMRKAWLLGQTYWQQADSESWSQNKKAAGTQEKFQQLVDETRAAILDDGE